MHPHEPSEMTIAEFERRLRDVGSELEALVQARDGGELLAEPPGTEISRLTRTRLAAELRRVEAALLRLSKGRFGVCSRCALPIEKDRLLADPAVRLCGGCAQGRSAKVKRKRSVR